MPAKVLTRLERQILAALERGNIKPSVWDFRRFYEDASPGPRRDGFYQLGRGSRNRTRPNVIVNWF